MKCGGFSSRILVAAALCGVALHSSQVSAEPLQPWQMVRSLQLVQDRIADGDAAAMPMQRKLLEMIDARLRAATSAELAEPRNWDAVMIYATAGGNPATVRTLMPDLLAAANGPALKELKSADEDKAAHGEDAEEEGEGESTAHEGPALASHEPEAGNGAATPADGEEATDPISTHSVEASKEAHNVSAQGDADEKPASSHGSEAEGDASQAPPPATQRRDLALGLYNFGRGREDYAAQSLGKVDPLRERPELGAFVALIEGSLKARSDPAGALKLFDQARLVAPGTLVEEAALRRSVALAVQVKDRDRFLLASGQYVRRFGRSPYASQFADGFVAGAVALQEGLDLDTVAAITADMSPEQERVVYLRIARQAGIENRMALSAFASARAAKAPAGASTDARPALYSALSEITGDKSEIALAQLDQIDQNSLTASDRELLEAVRAIAEETTRPPGQPSYSSSAVDSQAHAAPPPEGDTRLAQDVTSVAEVKRPPDQVAKQPDPVETGISEMRNRLGAVDELLEEADR